MCGAVLNKQRERHIPKWEPNNRGDYTNSKRTAHTHARTNTQEPHGPSWIQARAHGRRPLAPKGPPPETSKKTPRASRAPEPMENLWKNYGKRMFGEGSVE